jgi:hypothetical protein
MNTIPQELNWVETRAACTAPTVFNQLCDAIRTDVEAINSVRHLTQNDHFQADMHSSGTTIIVGQPNKVPRPRVFVGIVENRIEVHQEWDGKRWKAFIGLNDQGRCILRLEDGTEIEQWQFRKKALEGMFFGD